MESVAHTEQRRDLPFVSFIMPTLNVEALLEKCLASIVNQDYPRDRYEILLADAHSTDRTRDIAKQFGATVLDDNGENMEQGKRMALQHARGEYIVFVDADNEISHPDYVRLAVTALASRPEALGVEAYYPPSPRMTSFCAYVTYLLQISDPICWLLSQRPMLVAREGDVERWALPQGTYAYPLGANGFVYRRKDLDSVKASEKFQDTHVAMYLMQSGRREWLRMRHRGVHHYYSANLWSFLLKRRRATVHFLNVRREFGGVWLQEKPAVPGWVACLYCVSFVGPAYHALIGMIRDRDLRWLWHIPASVASLAGAVWGYFTHRRHAHEKNLISRLQPKQK
jgi:glycosyltransferase involved in cell wall biosynthesis